MFAFAVRLRRKRAPAAEVKKKDQSSTKLVILGVMCTFFGGIFFFFETVGKCSCKLDYIGGFMMTFGMVILTFKCIADLCHSLDDDEEDVEDMETGSIASSYLSNKEFGGEVYSIFKPVLISRELSPANSDLKLIGKQDIRVITCAGKINSKLLKEGYNLPAIVVDT
ncbi:hypothetical protein HDE_01638 [Halotydeus destructor]|nr:hypothetical protein HDE_01638 [Halotydeus destructor]